MGYAITGIVNTKETRGGTLVTVREFQVVSLPSETYFEFRRTPAQSGFSNPGPAAQQLSDRIEAVLGLANVVDVVWSQNATPGGKLVDWMTTYYETPNGAISGSVESSLAHFGPNYTGAQIAAEIAGGGDVPAPTSTETVAGSDFFAPQPLPPSYFDYGSPTNPQAPTVPGGGPPDAYNTPGAPGPGV